MNKSISSIVVGAVLFFCLSTSIDATSHGLRTAKAKTGDSPKKLKAKTEQMMEKLGNVVKLGVSAAVFHLSLLHNKIKYGDFTFHHVAGDGLSREGRAWLERDVTGAIVAINDGKQVPLVLSSIPGSSKHMSKLKEYFGLKPNQGVAIYSFNRKFERDWAALSTLVKQSDSEILYKYPTTDFCSPLLVDLIRFVRDLKSRDEASQSIALVHCKAGRGRSATAIIAYLMTVFAELGEVVSSQELECYLKCHRRQVAINKDQHAILGQYQNLLMEAGSFEQLCEKYEQVLADREVKIKEL